MPARGQRQAAGAPGERNAKTLPPSVRPSSSILLLSPTNQVLLLHRVHTSSSFASAHVFPGGNLSPFHDGPLLPPDSPDLHNDSPAYRLAAIRETFEESGILLVRKPGQSQDQGLLHVPEDVGEAGRKQVHGNQVKFTEWVKDLGGKPDVENLIPFTRWITPPGPPRRFTTQMYLYMVPLSSESLQAANSLPEKHETIIPAPSHDGGLEHTAATFDDARTWLERARRGEIILFPPQFYLLHLVSQFLQPLSTTSPESTTQEYQAQRTALLSFLSRIPTSQHTDKQGTCYIPWPEKVISPTALFVRQRDGRMVLGLDKPGPELRGSQRGGDWDRVVLVRFEKDGPRDVEVRWREEVVKEEREVEAKFIHALNIMAPGILTETPSADETAKKLEVVAINGKAVGKEVEQSVNGEKPANGETQKPDDDSEQDGASARPDGEGEAEIEVADDADGESEPEDQTMKCEIKHLDRRYNDEDELYFTERKAEAAKPKQKDWWRLFAFCMVRSYNVDDEVEGTSLYVNPQPLRQLLYDVIGNFPGNPIDVDNVQIDAPYHALFYYRKELEAEGFKRFAEDPESLEQLKLLLNWIKTHFELDIAAYERCTTQGHKVIAYDKLWTLFPPGTIAYCKLLSQNRAIRAIRNWYDTSELNPCLLITANFVDFDGDRLGTRRIELGIPKYQGMRELSELSTIPLDLLDDAADVREELLSRGRRFEGYIGQHFLHYDGIAIKKTPEGYARFTVNGRVMIDCKTYHRLEPNDAFTVVTTDEKTKMERSHKRAMAQLTFAQADGTPKFDKMSDEDAMLTNATVRGYSFTTKRFLEFFVEDLSEIEWNTKCFDDLVLDPAVKRTVQALVSTHAQKRESFDDIVKGKGMGLVCVLHGPPGVGKTLTAECVAEFVKRPLYMVSSGDLGTCSADLDRALTRIMDMTATWRAVLLIDEADVFLERRSLHDLHRNAMVSVFLRVLEYYSGILFLTTNRVTTFDDAFKSRIHIPIRYTDLTVDSRKQIWRNFCRMVPGGVDIDEKGLATLAESDLNGRQIKNAVKAAESLASFDGAKLDLNQLLQITKIQAMFESDLTSLSGVDYTAPGASKKDADSRNMFL
ncbi:hypothetical protein C8A03DRAFT_43068 [Achaetomium macrosporum]|uniref:Nudix hydrolase domain-containing protein n=1 Tax=Achaetomium macrosporum TaxID=79813 RepID=A0AAN7CCL6_9PEZI|nr:hypothetical protein C8A03DRAFT_43068 [Achaetomium macrosporum]